MTAIFNPTGLATVPPVPRPAPPAPDPAPAAPEPVVPTAVGPVLELPGTPGAALVPVTCSGRPVGAFVLADGRVRYHRVVDPDQLVTAATGAFAVAALTAAVALWSRRRPPAVGSVTMGPGGWLSLRGASIPRPRPEDRPWWARLLRAHPLPR
ncbi:hypothetical protein O7600_00665 [Micromonospora sp. WMMA1998]|uniref:hypothetical protein n=1 Tax=Micromonospora sp. WMMA1998 TaxID=3015167 RepID=UPI00248A9F00|nr:hypothetical protein [Micromonospora sp. WMMA1998]WBC15384.1 hypothetical protein O7600_00665 [Micromonospora sp. WMMA1998]